MLIVYVGHDPDGVEIDGIEDLAEPGVPVDVPDDLAGRPPSGHRVDEDYDPGAGLLAQPANWAPAEAVKPPAAAEQAPATVKGSS